MTQSPLFDLRLPVIAAPMFLCSGPELVVASCKAGIIGSFPTTNCRNMDELDAWMREIVAGVGALPWAANLITHSTNARLADDLARVATYRPPLVITALGSPKPAIETVHGYGGKVFADVINLNLARKAVASGADGLVCIAAGAGGHTGFFSPFAFISALREFFDGPIVIGGGISDGAGIAGAIAAGADYVYVGTRFLPTQESRAVDGYKQMIVDCGSDDLVVSAAITGTPASWLKPSLAVCGITLEDLAGKPDRNYAAGEGATKRWRDTWSAGQGLHTSKAVEPVAQVVDELERGYHAAIARFADRTSPPAAAQRRQA